MALTLIIGNKNYSSWSLRSWLALKAAGIGFEERLLPIASAEFYAALAALNLPPRVPVLLDDGEPVWDSLAIVAHVAELFPHAGLWPEDRIARGHARAICAEMHAGFSALRRQLPMNLWRPPAPCPLDARGEADVTRIAAIWRCARGRFGSGGAFLFGAFSAADAYFAPVASRFATYAVPLDAVSAAYVRSVLAHPEFRAWRAAALTEPWVLAADEVDWPQVKREG